MSVGEFGSDYDPLVMGGQVATFAYDSGPGSATALAAITPDGSTWILEGVDFYGETTDTASIVCTIVGPGGNITWGLSINTFSSPVGLLQGAQWRGRIPYSRGQRIEASVFCTAHPNAAGVTCWGRILPYDIA